MTFGSGVNGCLGHGNFQDVAQVKGHITVHFCTNDKNVISIYLVTFIFGDFFHVLG